jgi:hypothetical protein
MLRTILKYGVISGVIVAVPMFVGYMVMDGHPPIALSMAIGYATMLLALSMVFIGVKRQRDTAGGGVIRFWPALGMGLAISAIAGVFYVGTWELTQAINGHDFVASYTAAMIAEKQAQGAGAAEIQALRTQMAQFAVQYADPLYRLPMTFVEIFPVGVLVSLVSAALLRNSRFLPARRTVV